MTRPRRLKRRFFWRNFIPPGSWSRLFFVSGSRYSVLLSVGFLEFCSAVAVLYLLVFIFLASDYFVYVVLKSILILCYLLVFMRFGDAYVSCFS